MWQNYKTGEWMLIEEKRFMSDVRKWQRCMFNSIHKSCRGDGNYKGMHLLQFENTSPEDGRIFLNRVEITKDELLRFLRFGK